MNRRLLTPTIVSILTLLFAHLQFAEVRTWTDNEGNSKEAELVNAFGPMAYFKDTEGIFQPMPASNLIESDQAVVEAFKAAKISQPWEKSNSDMSLAFKNRLFTMQDGEQVNYKFGPEPEPDFYVLYYVSPQDEEGVELTSKIKNAYQVLRQSDLNNFEIILVTQTRNSDDQKDYMVESGIPWPAIKMASRKRLRELNRIKGKGSLNLVILDKEGHILHRTVEDIPEFQPANILVALNNLLAWTNMENPVVIKYRFMQMLEDRLAKSPANAGPQPYQCDMSGIDFASIPEGFFKVKMVVNASGFTEDVEILTDMPENIKEQAMESIATWLFIPRVKDGAYVDTKVSFPIQPKQ